MFYKVRTNTVEGEHWLCKDHLRVVQSKRNDVKIERSINLEDHKTNPEDNCELCDQKP